MKFLVLTFFIDVFIFLFGLIVGSAVAIEHSRRKLYDKDGKCKECNHPKTTVADHADGRVELRHHPNCPIGRLGI